MRSRPTGLLSRAAGRLVTSPLAFLLAGVYDVSVLLILYARHLALTRVRRALRRS